MVGKILRKDFLRKKLITLVVFTFILLAALLVASGSNLIVELSRSLDYLFVQARAPHFVQMHAGTLDPAEIDRWAAAHDLVEDHQVVEMITVDGSALYLGESETAEENSIMDISFVRQNTAFDFLLDLDNRVIQLAPGEIAVPIYYMEGQEMELGDAVRVRQGAFEATFTVAAFVRDAQMNPPVVHSKRFLVHEADYARLREHFHETEYLIEFLLTTPSQIGAFGQAYAVSGLPDKGPAVDYRLFKIFDALTDGIVAGMVIALSLLLMVIAILCLRFTILATIEEDYKEIGVLKAMGIAKRDIRRIYLAKYVVMGGLAALLGYGASLLLNPILSTNVMLYIGSAPKGALQHAVPLIAAGIIFLMVWLSCAIILRRFSRISAVEALRSGSTGDALRRLPLLDLSRRKAMDINVFLGVRDVFQRFKLFGLLYGVFFFCASIILIPIHFMTTMQSPTFISYMGIGQSDMRIDLRPSDDVEERFEALTAHLAGDPDVERFTPLVTARFEMLGSDGAVESINVETGDFSLFPLEYVRGGAPVEENEIALSVLNAQDMGKQVGDTLVLLMEGREREMTVSGIYQDVTNGGRTAKAVLPFDPERVLWYAVSLDLKSPDHMEAKMREYTTAFHPARVTDLEGYVGQTLGNTVAQLGKVTLVAILVGLSVAVLITSLFLNMLITKDAAEIAIMRSLGFSLRHIRIQYLSRALALLGIGVALGTLFSNTLGQRIVSAMWSFMGASQIRFVIDPLRAYVLFPLLLLLAVSITTLVSVRGVKEANIAATIVE